MVPVTMPAGVKILLDSIGPAGNRLTTFECTYQRFIHSEIMTHRVFSRNAASSRAIPIEKMIERVEKDPAMPRHWGKNQAGMQAREELDDLRLDECQSLWLKARDEATRHAWMLASRGLHKQIVNRVLEPFSFITVIITATEYENFFKQRCHPDAQPEIKWVADEMQRLYRESVPYERAAGDWHMPLLCDEDFRNPLPENFKGNADEYLCKVSVARCARVSYLTHDGKRDIAKDLELYERLATADPPHWSPMEHVAMALPTAERSGNFAGWRQLRKTLEK